MQSDRHPIKPIVCSLMIACCVFISGCATTPLKPVDPVGSGETRSEQIDAASKVMGAMGGKEISSAEMKAVVKDVRKNKESRSAVEKIIGAGEAPVIKYSPATGKHYSGDLEFDPETGVKLEVIEE